MNLQFISETTPSGVYSTKPMQKKKIHNDEPDHPKITRPEDVVLYFGSFFQRKRQEYFCALNLNGAGEVISARIVTIGLLNHSLVHPREVFRDAIIDSSASIICIHNHPSGSVEPSSQDFSITTQLKEAGNIIGIQVIDHIIITPDGRHYSMREHGQL